MENFDDAHDGLVKLSIKQAHKGNDVPGPYELYRFELNCSGEKIRALSWAEYDASGTLKKSGEGGRWGASGQRHLVKFLKMVPVEMAKLGRNQTKLANLKVETEGTV